MFGIFYLVSGLINKLIENSENNSATRDSYNNAIENHLDIYWDSRINCMRTIDTHEPVMTRFDTDKNGKVYLVNPNTLKVVKEYQVRKPKRSYEEIKKECDELCKKLDIEIEKAKENNNYEQK